jgi:phosphatidylserine decarboxylase
VTQLAVEEEEAEEETEEISLRSPWDPMKEARCIAVASRWAQSREVLELDNEEETLATRLIAAMNVSSTDINGDGLDEGQKIALSL